MLSARAMPIGSDRNRQTRAPNPAVNGAVRSAPGSSKGCAASPGDEEEK